MECLKNKTFLTGLGFWILATFEVEWAYIEDTRS